MQIALTLILALLAIAALATAMRAIVIARAAAWMDMVAIGATDSCESAGYVGCSVVCTGVENMQQIESLLDVEYDRYETIVVLDARAAGITFRAIVARYDLIRVDADPSDEFPSARIRSLFRSRTRSMRRLTLVDRAAASPYDDLDAGASVASYDYILPVGRDTYLMPNAIEKAVIAIASTPDTPIAALHSVSDDQCYVFNRETLIAQGGFSPHLLNSIRSGEVRRTFVPPHIPHEQHTAHKNCYPPNNFNPYGNVTYNRDCHARHTPRHSLGSGRGDGSGKCGIRPYGSGQVQLFRKSQFYVT